MSRAAPATSMNSLYPIDLWFVESDSTSPRVTQDLGTTWNAQYSSLEASDVFSLDAQYGSKVYNLINRNLINGSANVNECVNVVSGEAVYYDLTEVGSLNLLGNPAPFAKCPRIYYLQPQVNFALSIETPIMGGSAQAYLDVPEPLQTMSVTVPVRDSGAEAKFESLFNSVSEEQFEDGVETEFSKELELLVKSYGVASKEILSRLLENEEVSRQAWAEALRWLGRMNDTKTHESRLWILERALQSEHAFLRDGAALGLAAMDDPSAIPYLERAVNSEELPELREDLRQVIDQLVAH